MTRMLGLGSPGASGGVRGVGRSLLFRPDWGRLRPFFCLARLGGTGVHSPKFGNMHCQMTPYGHPLLPVRKEDKPTHHQGILEQVRSDKAH